MSLKTETIEVRRCDFCISTTKARRCDHCERDACADCGQNWIVQQQSVPQETAIPNVEMVMVDEGPLLKGFFCRDCVESEAETAMLGFGFSRHPQDNSTLE